MNVINDLKDAIFRMHGCKAEHIGSVPVLEVFRGQVIWDGEVEMFDISGHRSGATTCFAWAYQDDAGKTQYTAVLQIPPVHSARDAVRAAIVAKVKNEGEKT